MSGALPFPTAHAANRGRRPARRASAASEPTPPAPQHIGPARRHPARAPSARESARRPEPEFLRTRPASVQPPG